MDKKKREEYQSPKTLSGHLPLVCLCLALLLAGCATTKVAHLKNINDTSFFGKDYVLLTPGDAAKGQAGLRYFNPEAQWTKYHKIILTPVSFWGDSSCRVSQSEQQVLCAYLYSALKKQFGERFRIIHKPGPDVMELRVAIADAEAATPGLRTLSLVVPQARVLSTVTSLATGKEVFAGSVQLESKLTDAQTGQLLAEGMARRIGGGNLKAAAQWKWGDAENAMDEFAKRGAANLYALTTGAAKPTDLPVKN